MSQLRALWWWIDRWRKSTAYTDMTLEEQGAYRNLLDEQTLRGGFIPNDERVLSRACGDAVAWSRVRDAVLARFELSLDGWENKTLKGVNSASVARAERQKRYRARVIERNAERNVTHNTKHNEPRSPSPYQDQKKKRLWSFPGLQMSEARHACVAATLGPDAKEVDFGKVYEEAGRDYLKHGEPPDVIGDLKKRARRAIPEWDPIPSVEETRRRMQALLPPQTPEERAAAKEAMRGILSLRRQGNSTNSGQA